MDQAEETCLTLPKIQKATILPMLNTPALAIGRGTLAGTKPAMLLVMPFAAPRSAAVQTSH